MFGLASAYAFLSAILVSVSLNTFVSVRLANHLLSTERCAFYLSALFFFLSAVSLFVITWNLESARNQWLAEGAIRDESMLLEPIEMRSKQMYVAFIIGFLGCILGSVLITLKRIPFL